MHNSYRFDNIKLPNRSRMIANLYTTIMSLTVNYSKKIAFVLFVSLFGTANEQSKIYANSASGDDVTGTGASGSPVQSFYQAYTLASSGDTILLDGTFTWTDAVELGDIATSGFVLDKNLVIQGVSKGSAIVQAAATRGTADRGVFFVAANRTVTFMDLIIRHGSVNQADFGGGITLAGAYCGSYPCPTITGTAVLNNVDVVENDADGVTNSVYRLAGGIYLREVSTITIDESTISDNDCDFILQEELQEGRSHSH